MQLEQITAELINSAIDIYLQHAYEDEALREKHCVHFESGVSITDAIGAFECQPTQLRSYVLRLGCQHYPHLKLALWEAYYKGEFVFAVDRHDGFDFEKTGPDYEAWLGIKSKNFGTKTSIEDAWYEAGVPTLRKLKEECLSRSDIMREFSGQEVLVIDNDNDVGAIMQIILSSAGYGCRWVSGVKETLALLQDVEYRTRCGMALVDLMLADGSGLEVIQRLRAQPETQEIPIVLTSAMSPDDVDASGANGYLQKPYSAQDLLETVAMTIRTRYDRHDRLLRETEADANARG